MKLIRRQTKRLTRPARAMLQRCSTDSHCQRVAIQSPISHPSSRKHTQHFSSQNFTSTLSQASQDVSCRASDLSRAPYKQSKALAESARDQPPRNPIKFNPLVNVNPRTHQSERAGDRKIAAQSAVGSDPGGRLTCLTSWLWHYWPWASTWHPAVRGGNLWQNRHLQSPPARHCAQKFVTASSSPERHVQKAQRRLWRCRTGARIRHKARRWLLNALGPCLRPGIRHGADGSWNLERDRCWASRP
ncbi:hypothetical protein GGI35DRAFT_255386 [Trichoderma velutinum]